MINITPDAAKELQALAASGGPSILRLDAEADGNGSYDCSVALVSTMPTEAKVESISGVTVAFCGFAQDIFSGATLALTPDGELSLDMAEEEFDSCGGGCSCGDGCCGCDEE